MTTLFLYQMLYLLIIISLHTLLYYYIIRFLSVMIDFNCSHISNDQQAK